MCMDHYGKFDDKRILIWGYGHEGKSTEQFLKTYCSPRSFSVFEGKREDIVEDDYDYIIKSPGIVMHEDKSKYTSQTQIFLECFSKCTVGITGTKGKSTTSALLYHVLRAAGKDAYLLGNIGEPCLDHFGDMTDSAIAVFEMSCHQLEHINVSPHIAVFLNLYEEHLDYYGTFDRYAAAKLNIARFQGEDDLLFAGSNVSSIPGNAKRAIIDPDTVPEYDLKILGRHNMVNAHFVSLIASNVFHVDDNTIKNALKSFDGLDHRLSHIGCVNGIDCYDDSISTIPGATIQALSSVENAGTVLIGGMDRGISYDTLIDFINVNRQYNYIFSYDSGKRIYDSIEHTDNCYYEPDLKSAVTLGLSITPAGKALILSPASASYGYFKNFEERGRVFASLVGLGSK